MAAYWDGYGNYEPTKPIEVKGGIKAKSKRGGFARSWWAKCWIETLESFNIGARLSRGKSYARKGQVTSIKIEAGLVRAKVQGSDPTPYSVTIKVRTLTSSEWELLAEKLALRPIFAAKLLAGEMPEDIDSVFRETGLSLFPETLDDLETDCSCPDWSNPCKHIAAVYYLLGEEFDRDPFLIFKLRGVDMDDFMSILGKGFVPETADQVAEAGVLTERPEDKTGTALEAEISSVSPEPLPFDPETFWGRLPENPEEEKSPSLGAHIPQVPAALPKRLGKFPFWRSEEDLLDMLEEIYKKVSPAGMMVFLGERK
ncbi:SWF/SNF family helicase [Methanosarcina horonobensis HB-1 = JCM 15518]|uniref:SWF/SNF family helicase n=1 Tax=Methanosarcina horonobensis HB-1 = JCM 15518 TaxID=1434110 RepID=A0A0E3SIM2_9EURY|nr:SWIM zinc finger family protein [Methanosarcina horonobensis]AKB80412.1 SWF/SNF family helicase [Methanosarcina horonobensis HB-1 = JCM 15518]